VQRALDLLSPATRARQEALDELERMKSDIHKLKTHLEKELREADVQKRSYEQKLREFEKERDDWLKKSVRQAERKLDDIVAQAKVTEVFRKHNQVKEVKNSFPEVVGLAPKSNEGPFCKTAEEFAQRFPPGTKVFVPPMSQDGLVQSLPNAKGEVQVLSNSLRLSLPWDQLKPPQKATNSTAQILRQTTTVNVALQESDRNLDLRGKQVEEAISELEMALDSAARNQEDRMKVVHGFGTEVLKKAVRTYLSRSIYVKKWKAGSPESGGDGITWVELNND
jgi:DNA mismatch repair protein MutS2